MKRFMAKVLLAVCMVVLILSSAWAEKPIRILSLYPLSGPIKANSEQWTLGEKLAVEEVNAQGGLLGRKIELIFEDTLLKPDVATSKAQKYLLDGKVDILIGAGSNVVKPLQDLAKQYNIPLVMFAHADEETGKNFSYNSIRPTWNTAMSARATVAYAAKTLKAKKYYILNQDYSYGRDNGANIKKELARQIPGAQIVGEDYHPLMSKDLSPFLTKVKMSGAEVLLTADYGLDISVLMKQRRDLGIKATVLGPGLADVSVARENPEAAFGAHACDTWFNTNPTKESVDFINNWKKFIKSNEYPIPTNLSARDYIGMKFLLEGIRKAGSVEAQKLIPALEGLHMKSITGEVYMRGCDHQMIMPIQCVSIDKKAPPFFGVPVTMPVSVTMIDEQDIDNPRCKKK
ncbi:MAG: ABC transporter substrate-binding protein [Deltaproteobacteria bacterium]|nr:ABC transporter substrate-binding protein [Deltaproteobacteria bacterium]